MKTSNNFYFQILFNSLKVTWRYKILWIFGLFVLLLDTGQWHKFLSPSFFNTFNEESFIFQFLSTGIFQANILEKIIAHPFDFFVIFMFLGLIIFFLAFFVWMAVVSQGGVIYSLFQINQRKKISVFSGVEIGRQNFWRVLILNIVEKYILWPASLLISLFGIWFLKQPPTGKVILSFIFLAFFILFLAFISLVARYALAFIVLKGKNPWEAIKEGAELFFKNWAISIETAAFLFIVNYFFKYLIIWVVAILLIPLSSFGAFSLSLSSGLSFDFYFIIIPLFISLLILWSFSLLAVYNYAVWVSVFTVLVSGKISQNSLIIKTKNKITSFIKNDNR